MPSGRSRPIQQASTVVTAGDITHHASARQLDRSDRGESRGPPGAEDGTDTNPLGPENDGTATWSRA